jgi:hypothetical protein
MSHKKKMPQPRRFVVKISQSLSNIVTTEVRAVMLMQLAAGNQKAQNGMVFSVMKFVRQSVDIYQPA